MNIVKTKLSPVLLLEPKLFKDSRGFFMELYKESAYQAAGISAQFVQDNMSGSLKGAVRGLHYQLNHPQGKLVSIIRGAVFDVVVDIRVGSPSFGEWVGFELSETNHKQVYVPPGFAHGYCALSEEVIFHYKCTDYYHPEDEYGLLWSDPELNIAWPLEGEALISAKDAACPLLKDVSLDKLPRYLP